MKLSDFKGKVLTGAYDVSLGDPEVETMRLDFDRRNFIWLRRYGETGYGEFIGHVYHPDGTVYVTLEREV
jgi:hypothetical protein